MEPTGVIRPWDLCSLILYFAVTLGIGLWSAKRQKSTEDYFVAGRRIAGWAIGLSMMGAAISSVTFLAYPGSAYSGNWSLLVPGLMLPIAAVVAIFLFIPFYRRARLVSAYEYLEMRFGPWARVYGCIMWTIHQFFRMGTVLYLLALPIKNMTGFGIYTIIWVTGVSTVIYTVLGGCEAVIWTDVMQTIVLLLGGIICIIVVFAEVPGGPLSILSQGWANQKFSLSVSFDWNLVRETFWVLALYGLFQNLQEFACDQTKLQRYCAAESQKAARRSVWIGGVGCIPVWMMFMFIGTCLWVYYQTFPVKLPAGLRSDEVYPFFIMSQLPDGLAGFVVAAVLAAAMSTLSACLNGVATVLASDIYRRHLAPGRGDQHYLFVARLLTGFAGIFMVITAVLMSWGNIDTILAVAFFMYSVVAGGLGGLFFLGFLSTRANSQGAAVGILVALFVTIWLALSHLGLLPPALSSPTHKFLVNVFSNTIAITIGYFAAYFFAKPSPEKLANLTWWTALNHYDEE